MNQPVQPPNATPEAAPKVQSKRPRRRWLRWTRNIVALVVAVFLIYHVSILYRVFQLKDTNPATTAFIERRAREAVARGATPGRNQTWVAYDQISPNLPRAVVFGEDPQFLSHSGLDWLAIIVAMKINWQEKRIVRGASTIDQQLVKNLFLSPSKNPLRKLHEALIAWEMDHILSKRRVMELYLNVIEWGDGIYGAEAAARHYFNTSAASLTDEQSAFLAAIIPNPRDTYNPDLHPDRVNYRRDVLLAYLHEDPIPEDTLRSMAVKTVEPTFPKEAQEQKADGVAIARVHLDGQGNMTGVDVLAAPHSTIRTAVEEAVKQWKFKPQNTGGQQETTGKLTFYYSIEKGEGIMRSPPPGWGAR